MNLEQVAHFIEHPQELNLSDASALQALSEKYPFASLFSLLYLKALANGKSVDLDSALQQHAYRLNDRRQLFQLVHSGGIVLPGVAIEMETVEQHPVVVDDIVHAPKVDIPVVESVSEPSISAPEAVEPEMPIAEEVVEKEEIQVPIIEETVEQASFPEAVEPEIEEEEEIISFEQMTDAFTMEQAFELTSEPTVDHPISSSPTVRPTDELPTSEVESESSLQSSTLSSPLPPSEGGEESASEADAQPEEAATAAKENPIVEGKQSFTDWLKSSNPEIKGLDDETPTPVKETPQAVKPKVEEIIDTFIREEPSISRSKTEFFSPSKKAKESLDEDALPVSETLAKIYAAQGNYPKAIHVYHQLMLSVPEKRSLFAVQIEALKKKITP